MTDEILKDGVLAAVMGTTVAGMNGMAGLANGTAEVTNVQVTTTMLHVGAVARTMRSDGVGTVIRKRMTRTGARMAAATRDRVAGAVQLETQEPWPPSCFAVRKQVFPSTPASIWIFRRYLPSRTN